MTTRRETGLTGAQRQEFIMPAGIGYSGKGKGRKPAAGKSSPLTASRGGRSPTMKMGRASAKTAKKSGTKRM